MTVSFRTGTRDSGESAVIWAVVPNTGQDVEELIEELVSDDHLWSCDSSYSGPGQWFHGAPWAYVTKTRILIQQEGGYDI